MQVLGNSYLVYRYFKYNNLHEFLMQLYLHNYNVFICSLPDFYLT